MKYVLLLLVLIVCTFVTMDAADRRACRIECEHMRILGEVTEVECDRYCE